MCRAGFVVPWMSDMCSHGHYSGIEVERLLDVSQTPDESVLFIAPDILPEQAPEYPH